MDKEEVLNKLMALDLEEASNIPIELPLKQIYHISNMMYQQFPKQYGNEILLMSQERN